MGPVLDRLFEHHNPSLVWAALVVCTFACATARAMVLRGRATQGRASLMWLATAGLVAGAGVWATHFIAMLAYDPGVPVRFELWLTVASALIAVFVPAVSGVIVVTRGGPVLAGMVFAAGVLAMHHVGMAAMEMPGAMMWDAQLVFASIMASLALGGVAGHVSSLAVSWITNIGSTTLRILTILVAHFFSMAAFTVVPGMPGHMPMPGGHASLSSTVMSLLIVGALAFILCQALILVVIDRHLKSKSERDAVRMRAYIAELEETKARLEQASAAAEAASQSKSAFLASMSHELRTPLNAILGFSETILTEAFGPIGVPRYKEYLENVHSSGKHLLALINDILDIARFDAGHAELEEAVYDPAAKIADVVRMMSPQARKAKVRLVMDLPAVLPLVNGDRRRMRQILLNLISNALKFTEPGGTVTIRAWVESGFHFQVADTGIGMAPQDFSKALEPFGQIDSSLARKYEGTGLGLPLTRQFVELHGGMLRLESTLGIGTTVTVDLPAWRIVEAAEQAA